MKEGIVLVALTLGALAGHGDVARAGDPEVKPQTVALMISLHRLHEGEIAIASIAARYAPSQDVRAFAVRVRREHEKLDERLVELAAALHVELEPEQPPRAEDSEEGSAKRRLAAFKALLEGARGAEVDRIFLAAVVELGESEVRRLREALRHIEQEKVHRYVARVRGVLASHVDRARALRKTIALH